MTILFPRFIEQIVNHCCQVYITGTTINNKPILVPDIRPIFIGFVKIGFHQIISGGNAAGYVGEICPVISIFEGFVIGIFYFICQILLILVRNGQVWFSTNQTVSSYFNYNSCSIRTQSTVANNFIAKD